jgi:hypothetical protein
VLLLPMLLNGCASTLYNVPSGATNEAAYAAIFPYYIEFCALSEIKKLPGTVVDVQGGGPGGHSVVYLNGVCREPDQAYPVLALCDGTPSPGQGVGLSVNAHYANANWTATPGRDFFFHGDLAPGEALTPASYARTQARAKALGIVDGVKFHTSVLATKPANISERDFKYEISAATDYAIAFGRDRYCARVPIDRARMGGVIAYLNGVNAPYRSGEKVFHWDVLRDNCAHLTHNALATVGLWRHWPTDRVLLVAAFDFPVPKNEFVNLMRRTNDLPIADPNAIYADSELRDALFDQDWLATRPGALAEAERAVQDNAMYDTKLRLIFYDEAITGRYQRRWDAIFSDPRYTDLSANLAYFDALYAHILADPPAKPEDRQQATFDRIYLEHIVAEKASLDAIRAKMQRLNG